VKEKTQVIMYHVHLTDIPFQQFMRDSALVSSGSNSFEELSVTKPEIRMCFVFCVKGKNQICNR
jgi:hypothetical protein